MNGYQGQVSFERRGFTLLELLVALSLSAVVLLGARAIAEQLADGAHRSSTAATQTDRAANAERVLREAAGRIEISARDNRFFDGTSNRARFETWCRVAAGWLERCSGMLLLDSIAGPDSSTGKTPSRAALLLLLSSGDTIPVRIGFTHGSLWYIDDADHGGKWYSQWGRGITVPAAIGVLIDADTTLLRLGDRG